MSRHRAGWLATLWLMAVGTTARAGYRAIQVPDGGAIRGRVHVVGEVVGLPPQPVFKEQEVCGTTMRDDRLVVGDDGALAYAVATLVGVTEGKPAPLAQPVVLDNTKCEFVPHVVSATVGQTLTIRNSDPFLHDAHATLGPRTLFNVAVASHMTLQHPLTDAGLIHVNCNVRHTWMHAYLYVAEHPYHAVTGPDGRFVIDGIPAGTYTLSVWHELLGSREQSVAVESGKPTDVDVALAATAQPPPEPRP